MHTAALFVDSGVASGRGWQVIHDDDCSTGKWPPVYESAEAQELVAAVHAIYDAFPWPYPEGIWPIGVFTAEELRAHLSQFVAKE